MEGGGRGFKKPGQKMISAQILSECQGERTALQIPLVSALPECEREREAAAKNVRSPAAHSSLFPSNADKNQAVRWLLMFSARQIHSRSGGGHSRILQL